MPNFRAAAGQQSYGEDLPARTQALQLDLVTPRLALRLPDDAGRSHASLVANATSAALKGTVGSASAQAPKMEHSSTDGESVDEALMETLGVTRVAGAYCCRGYRFQTLGQAVAYAEQHRRDPPVATSMSGMPAPAEVPLPATNPVNPPSDPDRAVMAGLGIEYRDGLYRCAGYGFTTLSQAMAHSRRVRVSEGPPPVLPARPSMAHASERHRSLPASQTGSARWYGPEERLEVAGFKIDGGLLYAGTARRDDALFSDPSLIDPNVAVSATASDHAGASFSYWPSYGDIPPASRRSYLEWLAGGRCDPAIAIGYVFIYFYGLERRVFIDQSTADMEPIVAEVRRLLTIYSENHSFNGYAKRLLTAVQLIQETELARPLLTPERSYDEWPMPLHIRRYLGAVLAVGTPFEADDALLWVLHLADTQLRTPGHRCFDEMAALWRIRFAERYPAGLRVRAPKARLTGEYRSASSRFRVAMSLGSLPDIAAVSAPLAKLKELLNSCIDDLAIYSRLLGRDPDARERLDTALCLPTELHATSFARGVIAALERLDAHMGEAQTTPTSVRWLCGELGLELNEPKMSATAQRQLAQILDRLNIAFEPDRRYGEGSLSPDGEMVIYRAPAGAPVDAEAPAYISARTMVEIASLAATADGRVVVAEIDSISADLQAMPELSATERDRLLAHALWMLRDPPRAQAALSRLMKLTPDQRQNVTRSALSAVLADGHVQPTEVRFLEKLFKTLDLPQDQLYAALHRGGVQMDEPVTISLEVRGPALAIPADVDAGPSRLTLDEARLARVRQETSEVSNLLAGIFAEPDDSAPKTPLKPLSAASLFPGLDGAHANLLDAVLADGELDRSAFEAQAKALRLLPDGAIETINDWGFETFDEPVLEGDDLVCLVAHLSEPLHAMRASP